MWHCAIWTSASSKRALQKVSSTQMPWGLTKCSCLDRWLHKARKEQKIVCLWQISVTLQINTQKRGHLRGESLCGQNCDSFWGELQQGRCLVTSPQPTRPPLHHHLQKRKLPSSHFSTASDTYFEPILCLGTDCISTLTGFDMALQPAAPKRKHPACPKPQKCIQMYTVFHFVPTSLWLHPTNASPDWDFAEHEASVLHIPNK